MLSVNVDLESSEPILLKLEVGTHKVLRPHDGAIPVIFSTVHKIKKCIHTVPCLNKKKKKKKKAVGILMIYLFIKPHYHSGILSSRTLRQVEN